MATRLMTPRLLLRQSFAGRGRVLAVGIALLMLGRAASLALPVTARDLIDRLRTDDATTLIAVLTLAVLTAALIQAVASYVSTRLVAVGAQRAIADLRIRLHRHALALPVRAFNETTVGSLSTRILSDVDALRQLMGSGLLQLLGAAFTALLALLALFWIHWQLTLAILAVFLAAGAVMAFLFGRARPLARARSQTLAAISGRLTESLSTIRVIKAYAAEPLVQAAFAARAVSLFEETRKSLHVAGLMSVLTVLAVAALTITTLQVGGRSLLAGEMTIGDLVAYFVLVGLLAGPIVTLANQGPEISAAQAALERIATFLAQDTEPTSHPDSPLPRLRGDIEFQDLDFAYPSGPPVLRGLSQRIQAGSTVAISGASGAGKSSLFSLLMGLEQPTGGCILIDGRPLTELPLAAYRAQLGAVLQDDGLFDGSIRDNVLLGRPDASEDEVRNACHLAHVMEFADRLPQRLETPVGERGVCLSGGQRQRIAIARAILRDPAILLLDEATAHLDQRSAAYVQAGLAALMRGRTTLIIAHQPSTIGRADRHLVLADGRLRPACASEPRAACA